MNRFSLAKQQALLEDLLLLLEEGVSVLQACEWMARIAKGAEYACLQSMLLALSHGQPVANGLLAFYPQYVVEGIRAGEQAGALQKGLRTAIKALQEHNDLRYTLFETLTYPLTVVFLGLFVLIFLKHSILNQFTDMVPFYEWPTHAQYLMKFADFLEQGWWLILLLSGCVVAAIRYVLYSYVGQFRSHLDALPLLKLYRQFIAADVMQRLSLLLANGMMLKSALQVLQQTAPPYLSSHLTMMEYRLGLGSDNMGDVLNTGLIHLDDIRRLQLIMETRNLEKALATLGRNAATQGHRSIKQTSRIVASMLLILAAGLALAMIVSVYDIGMSIGGMSQ